MLHNVPSKKHRAIRAAGELLTLPARSLENGTPSGAMVSFMGDDADVDALLGEQVAYYRARAGEYDLDMWESELDPGLRAEVADLERALADFAPTGAVLELGCGTGTWTRRLTQWATTITAVDASPEMIARAREKVRPHPVDFVVADLFSWTPARRFNVVFFSFVLSHVPPQRFDKFWNLIASSLVPGGRVFFIDAAAGEAAHENPTPVSAVPIVQRRLRDGSQHRVVKVFHEPAELQDALIKRGWSPDVHSTAQTFLWGTLTDERE